MQQTAQEAAIVEVRPESHSEKRGREAERQSQTWPGYPEQQDPKPEAQPLLPPPTFRGVPARLRSSPPKPPPPKPDRPINSIRDR